MVLNRIKSHILCNVGYEKSPEIVMENCKRSYVNSACSTVFLLHPIIPINYFFIHVAYYWLVLLAAILFLYIKTSPYITEKNGILLFVYFPVLKEIPIDRLDVDETDLLFKIKGSKEHLIFIEKAELKKSLILTINQMKHHDIPIRSC